jgi:hypothetical protein
VGPVVNVVDFNLAKAAVGKVEAAAFPTCAACTLALGPWSTVLTGAAPLVGRPVCQSGTLPPLCP